MPFAKAFREDWLSGLPIEEYNTLTNQHEQYAHSQKSSVTCPVEDCLEKYTLVVENTTTGSEREAFIHKLRNELLRLHPAHPNQILDLATQI